MHVYDDMFAKYSITVAQILLTKAIINNPSHCENFMNTVEKLVNIEPLPTKEEEQALWAKEAAERRARGETGPAEIETVLPPEEEEP